MNRILKAFAAIAVAAATTAAPASAKDDRIAIGWTAWSDAEVMSKMVTMVLRSNALRKGGYDVEAPLLDVKVQYRSLAEGDIDAMLMSWQPKTHAAYLDKYVGQYEDLGALYEGARLGLAVPAYVPESEVSSIADLAKPEVREKMGGAIQGIDPNAGIMSLTPKAMDAYGLGSYDLKEGTGPLMAKNLGDAIEDEEWTVVTAWTPHWKFAEHDLRFLDDPKDVYGGEEEVHALVRKGFSEDYPKVTGFLERLNMDLDTLQGLMADAKEMGHRNAVMKFVNGNRSEVGYWLNGD